jgi:arabinofuranan 3-O-arabinosyltransferase
VNIAGRGTNSADQRVVLAPSATAHDATTGHGRGNDGINGDNPNAGARRIERGKWLLAVLFAWLPPLLSAPGQVAADTKQFLYLDPAWLLGRTVSLWDPSAGLGTVTHQNIGYLWPMGPWFWVFDQLGVPMWIAQRLWFGAITFTAICGVRWLMKVLPAPGPVWVIGVVYALSPYQLAYLGRTSVLLLPWAGLPWILGLAVLAARRGGWRYPAMFALAVVTIGAVNASSLIYVGLAPLLWFPCAIWVSRELTVRQAVSASLRIGALSIPVNLWWMAGLRTQAAYGLPILQLTETVETVAQTTSAGELIRHLGYWYFYGRDGARAWTASVRWYAENPFILVMSFVLPTLSFVGAMVTRWRQRMYAVLLTLVGLVLAIGTHPYDDPAPVGAAVKAAANAGAAAMALRNSPRALPLTVLGMALCLGALLSATASWARHLRVNGAAQPWLNGAARLGSLRVTSAVVLTVAFVAAPAIWSGQTVQDQLRRPEALPSYWVDAARDLDAAGTASRVLELPGQDFGAYRWGMNQDVITRGLMQRPWVGRELIPFGSPESADLLRALDRRMQEGVFDPAAIAPVARLMGAGTVLARTDAEYERFRSPRPRVIGQWMDEASGLEAPKTYGDAVPNQANARQPLMDETELATPTGTPWPAPVSTYDVTQANNIVRTVPDANPLIVVGDGEGVVDVAEAGLLTPGQRVITSTTLTREQRAIEAGNNPDYVLTDQGRQRAERWGTLRENLGATEHGENAVLVDDPKDARLSEPAEGSQPAVAEWVPVADLVAPRSVQATRYGNPVSYTPEDRPANVIDRSWSTAWKVGAFDEVRGERLRIELEAPAPTAGFKLVQAQDVVANRWITKVRIEFDDQWSTDVALDDSSRTTDGQLIAFADAPSTFSTVDITVLDSNIPKLPSYPGISPVGFAEVIIDGIGAYEAVRVPTSLGLDGDGRAAIVLTRQRSNPAEPFRSSPEPGLSRIIDDTSGRSYSLTATVRLSPGARDDVADAFLGRTPVAVAPDRLAGAFDQRGSAALDGDITTHWSPGFLNQTGRWIEVLAGDEPVTIDRLDLVLVADGRHSVPTRLLLTADNGPAVAVDIPAIADQPGENATTAVSVALPQPLTFTTLRVLTDAVRPVTTLDFYSGAAIEMPIGIAELGIAGITADPFPTMIPPNCDAVSVSINSKPVALAVEGTVADALAGKPLTARPCEVPSVTLGANALVESGGSGPFALDRVVMMSAPDGGPLATWDPAVVESAPAVDVREEKLYGGRYDVAAHDAATWLVLGQSYSDGWEASVNGRSLGPPRVMEGYSAAWLLPPSQTPVTVAVEWAPQRWVTRALWVSGLAVLVCMVLIAISRPTKAPMASHSAAGSIETVARCHGAFSAAVGSPSLWATALTTTACALGGWLIGGPIVALVAGASALLSLRAAWGRVVTALGAPVVLGAMAVLMAGYQFRRRYRPGVEWPTSFGWAHRVGLVVMALVAVDVVVQAMRRRSTPVVATESKADNDDDQPLPIYGGPDDQ